MTPVGRNEPCQRRADAGAGSPVLQSLLRIVALMTAAVIPAAGYAQVFSGTDFSGAELFGRYCAACHGESGVGNGPVAATLVKVVPDLTRLTERAGGRFPGMMVAEVIDGRSPVIAHGTRRMPVWGLEFWIEEGGDIDAERRARQMIARLIDYLESIQTE